MILLRPFITEERQARIESALQFRTRSVVPVMENIYDRGNISAAMRSAEAQGFFEFHIIEAEEARFKTANRVTQGADKWLDVHEHHSTGEAVSKLKTRGYKIYATDLEAAVPIDEVNFSEPCALVFGNEKEGITPEMRELSDQNIILPMRGFSQSYNISVAAALSFYHAFQQRLQKRGTSGDLSEEELQTLRANYFYKAANNSPDILTKS